MQSVVADDAIIGSTLTNVIKLYVSDGISRGAPIPLAAVCDNGRPGSSRRPNRRSRSRSTTRSARGVTRSATRVDVTLPGRTCRSSTRSSATTATTRARSTAAGSDAVRGRDAQCLSGCPAPTRRRRCCRCTARPARRPTSSRWPGTSATCVSQPTERVYRITYQQTFKDVAEYQSRVRDRSRRPRPRSTLPRPVGTTRTCSTDANYQPGGRSFTAASSRTFGERRQPRQRRRPGRRSSVPSSRSTKTCQALPGRDDPATLDVDRR